MAELALNYLHSRGLLVLSYRNEHEALWKELLSLQPLEALELSRQLEQAASAVRLDTMQAEILIEKTIEHKTGREI